MKCLIRLKKYGFLNFSIFAASLALQSLLLYSAPSDTKPQKQTIEKKDNERSDLTKEAFDSLYNSVEDLKERRSIYFQGLTAEALQMLEILKQYVGSYDRLLNLSFDVLDSERINHFKEQFKDLFLETYASYGMEYFSGYHRLFQTILRDMPSCFSDTSLRRVRRIAFVESCLDDIEQIIENEELFRQCLNKITEIVELYKATFADIHGGAPGEYGYVLDMLDNGSSEDILNTILFAIKGIGRDCILPELKEAQQSVFYEYDLCHRWKLFVERLLLTYSSISKKDRDQYLLFTFTDLCHNEKRLALQSTIFFTLENNELFLLILDFFLEILRNNNLSSDACYQSNSIDTKELISIIFTNALPMVVGSAEELWDLYYTIAEKELSLITDTKKHTNIKKKNPTKKGRAKKQGARHKNTLPQKPAGLKSLYTTFVKESNPLGEIARLSLDEAPASLETQCISRKERRFDSRIIPAHYSNNELTILASEDFNSYSSHVLPLVLCNIKQDHAIPLCNAEKAGGDLYAYVASVYRNGTWTHGVLTTAREGKVWYHLAFKPFTNHVKALFGVGVQMDESLPYSSEQVVSFLKQLAKTGVSGILKDAEAIESTYTAADESALLKVYKKGGRINAMVFGSKAKSEHVPLVVVHVLPAKKKSRS